MALATRNLASCTLKAYPTDVEIAFSKDPFGTAAGAPVSVSVPAASPSPAGSAAPAEGASPCPTGLPLASMRTAGSITRVTIAEISLRRTLFSGLMFPFSSPTRMPSRYIR